MTGHWPDPLNQSNINPAYLLVVWLDGISLRAELAGMHQKGCGFTFVGC